MEEARELLLEEPSSHCPHKGKPRLPSPEKDSKDHQGDSLHRLLQKAALQSRQNLNWSHPVTSRTPQNLFLEGFRDCASEVIRFLTHEENMNDNSPLLVGLQSHLVNVSKTFCNESVADLDKQDPAAVEQLKYGGLTRTTMDAHNNVEQFYTHASSFSPCLISPIVARSVNSSLSDTSVVESDFSMSVSSGKDQLSSSSEANSSLCSTYAEIHDESFIDSSKIDDVFHSPNSYTQNLTSCCVLPLSVLSAKALQNKTHPGTVQEASNIRHHFGHKDIQELSSIISLPRYDSVEESSTNKHHPKRDITKDSSNLNASPLSYTETYTYDSWNPAISMPYHPSLNHSSPLPNSSTQSAAFSGHTCHLSQCLCAVSRLDPAKIETNSIPQQSAFSAVQESADLTTNHSVPGLLLSHQLHHFLQGQDPANSQRMFQNCISDSSSSSGESHRQSESSLLELKANLFPGIETTSMPSGSFADILLAVESCRFHEDPRVRSVAEELVHLIHDDELQDDDDFDYDQPNDDEEYLYNVDEVNDVESGVEMIDESSDCSSAVDMIEQ
ncbi:hypothetical protein BsWGS_12466 [Bradybaena similaris]